MSLARPLTRAAGRCPSPTTVAEDAAPAKVRWTAQWKELYDEVVDTGLCTGCAGCVIVCPHDVSATTTSRAATSRSTSRTSSGPTDCIHGEKGCTSLHPGLPPLPVWEPEADEHLFARVREPDELSGIYQDLLLTRASDDMVHQMGQDGGLVSAMLIWLREHDYIDGALVSFLDGDGRRLEGQARAWPSPTRRSSASAGSRYTYSANTLAMKEAAGARASKRLALVGMGCQTSSPPVMWHRKVGKIGKPILFNIGLLCSKTFDDAIFEELFETKYGLRKQDMVKMNIKGVFQIWTKDGGYHEINLKECHAWTREGCTHCPDFAAEHADISTGGIGKDNDWTLTVVRTDLGREVITRMIADGSIIARPADEDPGAIKLDAQAGGEDPRPLAHRRGRLPQEPAHRSAHGPGRRCTSAWGCPPGLRRSLRLPLVVVVAW